MLAVPLQQYVVLCMVFWLKPFRPIHHLIRLAVKHHPDKGGDPEKFKEINRAPEVLIDASKRAKYNKDGEGHGAANPGRRRWPNPAPSSSSKSSLGGSRMKSKRLDKEEDKTDATLRLFQGLSRIESLMKKMQKDMRETSPTEGDHKAPQKDIGFVPDEEHPPHPVPGESAERPGAAEEKDPGPGEGSASMDKDSMFSKADILLAEVEKTEGEEAKNQKSSNRRRPAFGDFMCSPFASQQTTELMQRDTERNKEWKRLGQSSDKEEFAPPQGFNGFRLRVHVFVSAALNAQDVKIERSPLADPGGRQDSSEVPEE
eukprot:Skav217664  [mRNA]  locus=scaffold2919:155548:158998:+ [translate_table: standard]